MPKLIRETCSVLGVEFGVYFGQCFRGYFMPSLNVCYRHERDVTLWLSFMAYKERFTHVLIRDYRRESKRVFMVTFRGHAFAEVRASVSH